MKKFREWLGHSSFFQNSNFLLPLSDRVKLSQSFYLLDNDIVLTVRIVNKNDIDDILTIQKKCYNGKTPWHKTALYKEISLNSNAVYLIMHDEEVPVAFIGAWFIRREAHVTNVGTIPSYEKKGIATFLMHQMIDFAMQEHSEILTLEVRVSNENAKSLYRTLGFVDGRIKKDYYSDDYEDALNMTYFLK